MTPSSDLKNHHISILHFWNKGIRVAPAIPIGKNIPFRTIYYNINKLKQTNSLKHRCENRKKVIDQYIRGITEITLNEVKEKLSSITSFISLYISTTSSSSYRVFYQKVLIC